MFNFQEAIQTGISKANDIFDNRKSINNVFKELNAALTEAKQKITIERNYYTERGYIDDWNESLFKTINGQVTGKVYVQLAEENSSDSMSIAVWSESGTGFPFTFDYKNQVTDCWDIEGIKSVLIETISDPEFWIKVNKLKKQYSEFNEAKSKQITKK